MDKNQILKDAYEMLKYSIPLLAKFPRDQRFLLGDKIQAIIMELLEILIEVYYSPPKHKGSLLRKANILLEKLRYFFRVAYELQYCPNRSFKHTMQQIDNIGRQVGGWIKSLERKSPNR